MKNGFGWLTQGLATVSDDSSMKLSLNITAMLKLVIPLWIAVMSNLILSPSPAHGEQKEFGYHINLVDEKTWVGVRGGFGDEDTKGYLTFDGIWTNVPERDFNGSFIGLSGAFDFHFVLLHFSDNIKLQAGLGFEYIALPRIHLEENQLALPIGFEINSNIVDLQIRYYGIAEQGLEVGVNDEYEKKRGPFLLSLVIQTS